MEDIRRSTIVTSSDVRTFFPHSFLCRFSLVYVAIWVLFLFSFDRFQMEKYSDKGWRHGVCRGVSAGLSHALGHSIKNSESWPMIKTSGCEANGFQLTPLLVLNSDICR